MVELDGAEVGQQRRGGRKAAKLKTPAGHRGGKHHPLRTDAHRYALGLGGQGQIAINLLENRFAAAGHRGNEQRETQPFAKKFNGRVNLLQRNLRQRAVRQMNLVEVVLVPLDLRVTFERAEVILFALVGGTAHDLRSNRR